MEADLYHMLFRKILRLIHAGQSDAAEDLLRQVDHVLERWFDFSYLWGVEYLRQGKIAEAIEAFEKVAASGNVWALPLYQLAVCYARTNDVERALEIFRRAVTLSPSNDR